MPSQDLEWVHQEIPADAVAQDIFYIRPLENPPTSLAALWLCVTENRSSSDLTYDCAYSLHCKPIKLEQIMTWRRFLQELL